ncbi:MAG TPA: alpha/beta hydrolase [Blastocatellia bacterium]|nr:alpha/beta hydrolase [Blastocatellia bacterium]
MKYAKLSDQLRLPYLEQGDPAGVPLLLLHGVTDSCRSFEIVLPHLDNSIHAFALTQRGHGDASRPESGYRFSNFAADVAAFMDSVEIEGAVIAGHSMGSSVAQRFAIDYPDRTLGLVLMGAFAGFRDNPGVKEFCESIASTLMDPVDPAIVQDFQKSTLARPVPETFYEMIVQESLKVPARVWRDAFQGFLEYEFPSELNNIKSPTLIIWGDQDAFCPRSDQEKLLATIKGSQLVVYEGSGHALHWEQPERFAADLLAFIKQLSRSQSVQQGR